MSLRAPFYSDCIMTRREIREKIFCLLFRVEFHEEKDWGLQEELFFRELPEVKERELKYIGDKYEAVIEKLPEIDGALNETAERWKTSRMNKVDLTILRLALYEMKYDDDIPVGVAVNEAVELAKQYGTDDSASFVNGILARLAGEIEG